MKHLRRDAELQCLIYSGRTDLFSMSSFSWASLLLIHHDAEWLATKRRELRADLLATGTRLSGLGKINLRWEDAVLSASSSLV